MFRDARMWHDALRIAEDYLPGKVAEIQMELASGEGGWLGGGGQYQAVQTGSTNGGGSTVCVRIIN
jgi:hypothetical protein